MHHRSDGWAPCAAAALICSSVAPFKFLASFCTLLTNVPHTPTMSSVELTQGSAEHFSAVSLILLYILRSRWVMYVEEKRRT